MRAVKRRKKINIPDSIPVFWHQLRPESWIVREVAKAVGEEPSQWLADHMNSLREYFVFSRCASVDDYVVAAGLLEEPQKNNPAPVFN